MLSTKLLNATIATACVKAALGNTARITATAGSKIIAATIGWGLVNPKKPGSASEARFRLYRVGMTREAYIAACVAAGQSRRNAAADLAWDSERGFIALA